MLIDFVDEEVIEMKILSELEVLIELSRDECFNVNFECVYSLKFSFLI